MGKRGPAPKPRELRILEGNPANRPLPEPVIVGAKLTVAPGPPADLTATQAAVWSDLAPVLVRAHLLDETNLITFRGLCVAFDRANFMKEHADACTEPTVWTERGALVANPIFAMELKAWALVAKLAVEFGLTPSARTRLGLMNVTGLTLAQQLEPSTSEEPIQVDYELDDDYPDG